MQDTTSALSHTALYVSTSDANRVSEVGGNHTYLSLPGSLPSTEALLQGPGCRGHGSPKSGSQLVDVTPTLLVLPIAAWKQKGRNNNSNNNNNNDNNNDDIY